MSHYDDDDDRAKVGGRVTSGKIFPGNFYILRQHPGLKLYIEESRRKRNVSRTEQLLII